MRKYWVKARRKPSRTNSKSCKTVSYTKGLLGSNSLGPFSFVDCKTPLLGWFHALSAALPGKYPTALTISQRLNLQCNSCFTFQDSHYGFFGPPCRDSPAIHLALVVFFNLWGRFHNSLLYPSMTKARTIWLKSLASLKFLLAWDIIWPPLWITVA